MNRWSSLLLVGAGVAFPVRAEEPGCTARIDRSNLITCALAASPSLVAESAQLRALEGRREAARPLLPNNPVVSASVGTRNIPGTSAVNWSVGLAQELELAGQRGLRVDVADAELASQTSKLEAVRQGVAQRAWETYFSALAGAERSTAAAGIATAASEFAITVRAMAGQGLVSDVDGRVAEALSLAAARNAVLAEFEAKQHRAELATLMAAPATVEVSGALEPLPDATGLHERPELAAAQQESVSFERRAALLRRARIPNPSLSVYVQNDGFNERVFGVGLQLPIPLPQPLGRTNAGQIAEAVASQERSVAETNVLKRGFSLELSAAQAELEARRRVRELYTPERVAGAASALAAIAREVKAARLPVREAITSQQALTELLLADVEAREALALASVRLARASGQLNEGGER